MNTEITNALKATSDTAQYDNSAKRLLGNKYILAQILVYTVDEFKGLQPMDVVPLIEGEPKIGIVPVEPGLTNERQGDKIIGLNTENTEEKEGFIRFDIVFYARMRDGLTQIIINVEAQKDDPDEYDILNRAIFYVSRMVSSQKERDFVHQHYNDIKKVYSIWVCMNNKANTLNHIHLKDDKIIGHRTWAGKLDLINIIMIGLADEVPNHDERLQLHRLLSVLLSMEMKAKDKIKIMEAEYGIPIEDGIREEVNIMCNLGEGLAINYMKRGWEQGLSKGMKEGIERGLKQGLQQGMQQGIQQGIQQGERTNKKVVILNMYADGVSMENIIKWADADENLVKAVIAEYKESRA